MVPGAHHIFRGPRKYFKIRKEKKNRIQLVVYLSLYPHSCHTFFYYLLERRGHEGKKGLRSPTEAGSLTLQALPEAQATPLTPTHLPERPKLHRNHISLGLHGAPLSWLEQPAEQRGEATPTFLLRSGSPKLIQTWLE